MAPNKCPDCGSQGFYVKDSEDQYNISEFDLYKLPSFCSRTFLSTAPEI